MHPYHSIYFPRGHVGVWCHVTSTVICFSTHTYHICLSISRSSSTTSSNSNREGWGVGGGCHLCSKCTNFTGELLQGSITTSQMLRIVFKQFHHFLFDIQLWRVQLILRCNLYTGKIIMVCVLLSVHIQFALPKTLSYVKWCNVHSTLN